MGGYLAMMIAGMLKRRIEKYQGIVRALLEKRELDEEQESFLKKEKLI
jgi:uncharacterized protein YutE (UPF0331/DUF86 family)